VTTFYRQQDNVTAQQIAKLLDYRIWPSMTPRRCCAWLSRV